MPNDMAQAWMAVRALHQALDESADGLADALIAFVEEQGIVGPKGHPPSFRTDFGTAVCNVREDSISWDGTAVVDYARQFYPHQVIDARDEEVMITRHTPATVQETFYTTLADLVEVVGDEVVDPATGMVLGRIAPGKTWYSARLSKEAKAAAKAAVTDKLHLIVAIVAGQPQWELEVRGAAEFETAE
jgi:hypothetical protein